MGDGQREKMGREEYRESVGEKKRAEKHSEDSMIERERE